ncbi:MAG: alanine racemase [Myxococcota bacterium]|nr:alanine racemase [Myxococcota bacterium]
MPQIRPTTVHVHLDRLVANYRLMRAKMPGSTRILCPVKGDAYGHGALACAKALEAEGADAFGVALVEEGVALREGGVKAPVLCFSGIGGREDGAEAALRWNLTPNLFDLESAALLNAAARKRGHPVPVHLKVDTGMGRLGVVSGHWPVFLDRLADFEWLDVQGITTHFSSADSDSTFTMEQARRFQDALDQARQRAWNPQVVHAANSAAALLHPELALGMIRPGIALYGHQPAPGIQGLSPVMEVSTRVLFVKDIPANYGVSYGRRWVSERPTRLATLPVGYADGYMRGLSNKAEVVLHGARCPIRGTICMDLCMVDVTDLPQVVRPGDRVELMGAAMPAEELAAHAGTIVYEILTSFSERVPRRHVGA